MGKKFNLVVNFLRDVFWIDRLANPENYRNGKKGLLFYFITTASKVAYYMYFLGVIGFLILLIMGKMHFLIFIVFVVSWPLMYRASMIFQVVLHRIGKECNYKLTRNLIGFRYKFRLKPVYDVLVLIVYCIMLIFTFLFSFDYSFTSTNSYIYANSPLSLFTLLSLVVLLRFYVLRFPIVGISNDKIQYTNNMIFVKNILIEDIIKVSVDKRHYNKRVMIKTKYKTYYIDTINLSVNQDELKKAIDVSRK